MFLILRCRNGVTTVKDWYGVSKYIIGTNLLTKFHEDRKINVASRVLARKNDPPPGSHVFQPTGIIFYLIQDIIWMNPLTKFHEDRTVNVASRVLTRFNYSHIRKNAPPLGSHFFQANIIIFELIQNIIETNLLTKFYEDWTINVASREKCPAPGGHVFQATKTVFELIQDIIGTNLLTKFHDDRKINVTSRVLTRKIAPPPWWRCFSTNRHLFELVQDIIGMNLLTKKNSPPLGGNVFQANTNLLTIFHQYLTINVASRVHIKKMPRPCGHVFKPTGIIFKLVQDIIVMNLLTKFHEDWTINVASRVKNAPPLGSLVFQAKVSIFNSSKISFHEDWKINVASRVLTRKNAPPPGGHVFQPTGIIFELIQDIIGMNLLTKFYEDQTIHVAFRVKNAPPFCSHVFQANAAIFELIQDIIETNLVTKFHEDWTINVASRELTRQMLTPHNARRTAHNGQ
ncbi:hypothetical protein DPMN_032134 [Dreissena polymorpha]|uniref:Uncharacterized protein n=1 Tax=Dreissena polymorpha TaxID=45954 RepID=A0A9D4RHY8_DREPO|nr:hypothetical protein DPMN_032134 [Dreissena polymorpha]